MFGQADTFGPKYFMDEEVVMVSLNYRLNSFGFLNTGDGVVQGNMGLKDQVGLRWVQRHIHHFNGDRQRVVLIGESAGAACVHLHTLSPLSRGLFSGAISLSGTALSPWAQINNPGVQANEYGEGLGCSSNDTRTMVQCLKGLDSMTIARYHMGALIAAAKGKNSLFAPTVDSGAETQFLTAPPLELLRSGNISDRPWITGVNSGDGLVYLIAVLRNDTMRRSVNRRWDYIAPKVLSYQDHDDKSAITRAVSEYYLQNDEISQERIREANAMLSDRGFFLDSHDAAIMQSQVAPTYVYYYTYEGVFSGGNMLFTKTNLPLSSDYNYIFGSGVVWMNSLVTNRRQKSKYGICHGDEMPLLFNVPYILREVIPSDPDYELSRKMVGLWTSFAEDGIPETTRAGVMWEPVNVPKKDFSKWLRSGDVSLKRLNLDQEFAIINEPFYDRMQFWRNHSISYLPET